MSCNGSRPVTSGAVTYLVGIGTAVVHSINCNNLDIHNSFFKVKDLVLLRLAKP